MATRSAIGILDENKNITAINVTYDGMPRCYGNEFCVGKVLLDHYTEEEKIKALIDLGSISTIQETVEEQIQWQAKEQEYMKHLYGRPAIVNISLEVYERSFKNVNHFYLWDGNEWLTGTNTNSLTPLKDLYK